MVALAAAAAAALISSRRRGKVVGDPSGNGAAPGTGDDVRRAVDEARGRIRAEHE